MSVLAPETEREGRSIVWPEGRRFAFTLVDDTDRATVENTGPVYDFLLDHGIRTTKTVWPLAPTRPRLMAGDTLQEPDYLRWILDLQARGVEIAFHGATDHTSNREEVIQALDVYKREIGEDPRLYVAHEGQGESMYWGEDRLDGKYRTLYQAAHRLRNRRKVYDGHRPDSPLFWGDVCRERITYVRNFVFQEINTLRCDPFMPYYDPLRPYVNLWFSSSEGGTTKSLCDLLTEKNQDRLVEEGGACVAYTHFGKRFVENGQLHPRFAELIRRLSGLGGWFVPASTLLDFLRAQPGWKAEADRKRLSAMQRRWLAVKLTRGSG